MSAAGSPGLLTTVSHAVAVTITAHSVPVPAGDACALPGFRRTITVRLGHPLAGRVLIDGTNGSPIAAMPSS
jgi:hypothetical protein